VHGNRAAGEIAAKSAKLRRFSNQPVAEIVQYGEPILTSQFTSELDRNVPHLGRLDGHATRS
jgi:hypothetical protein